MYVCMNAYVSNQVLERTLNFEISSKLKGVQEEAGKQKEQMDHFTSRMPGSEAARVKRHRRQDLEWSEDYTAFQSKTLQESPKRKFGRVRSGRRTTRHSNPSTNNGGAAQDTFDQMKKAFHAQTVQKHWAKRDQKKHGSGVIYKV